MVCSDRVHISSELFSRPADTLPFLQSGRLGSRTGATTPAYRISVVRHKSCYLRHDQVLFCHERRTSTLQQPVCIKASLQNALHQQLVDGRCTHGSCEQRLQKLCQTGDLGGALHTLSQLHKPCTPYTYITLLRACSKSKVLQHAKCVFNHLSLYGTHMGRSLGEHLVMALAKCGAVDDACQVSALLPCRTVISWTALISAYVDCDHMYKAFEMYQSMQDDGVEPSNYTFVSLFKACGSSLDLEQGRKLHLEARTKGLGLDPFVASAVLSMYGKCGAVVEVEDTFCAIPYRDIVSWNTMLSFYVKHCEPEKALHLYRQMQEEGLFGSHLTFVIALQACGLLVEKRKDFLKTEAPGKGVCFEMIRGLHADARKMGYEADILVGNTLVSVYGKCGAIVDALGVFLLVSNHAIISWNAMLTAYVGQGLAYKSLQLYKQMQEEGTCPNELTFLLAFQACGILIEEAGLSIERCLHLVQAFHIDSCLTEYGSDVLVSTPLLKLYARCGRMAEAEDVFGALLYRDVVTWTAMLSAYVQQEHAKKALQLYAQMQKQGMSPNQLTCVTALQACGMLAEREIVTRDASAKDTALIIGHVLHADACLRGFTSDLLVATAIISLYAKCSALLEAEDVFNVISHRDTVAWNAMLSAYVGLQQGENALLFVKMMEQEHVLLDDGTVVFLLQASSRTGSLETTRQLHFAMVFEGCDGISSVAASLIDSYGSCGNMVDANACFNGFPEPDLVFYTACLCGHAGQGDAMASMVMLEGMKVASKKLDDVVLTLALASCSRAGLVSECIHYFHLMSQDQSIDINLKHYGILLDLFGRAGDFKRVTSLVAEMPMQADLTIWLSLLGACHVHGNIELANVAFDHAVNLGPKETSAYVLLSNASTISNMLTELEM